MASLHLGEIFERQASGTIGAVLQQVVVEGYRNAVSAYLHIGLHALCSGALYGVGQSLPGVEGTGLERVLKSQSAVAQHVNSAAIQVVYIIGNLLLAAEAHQHDHG